MSVLILHTLMSNIYIYESDVITCVTYFAKMQCICGARCLEKKHYH